MDHANPHNRKSPASNDCSPPRIAPVWGELLPKLDDLGSQIREIAEMAAAADLAELEHELLKLRLDMQTGEWPTRATPTAPRQTNFWELN